MFRGGGGERAKNRISIGGKISKIALKSTIVINNMQIYALIAEIFSPRFTLRHVSTVFQAFLEKRILLSLSSFAK